MKVVLSLIFLSSVALAVAPRPCSKSQLADLAKRDSLEQKWKGEDRATFETNLSQRKRAPWSPWNSHFPKPLWQNDRTLSQEIQDYYDRLAEVRFEKDNSWRDLDGYKETLGPTFAQTLNKILREGRSWSDLGAGHFLAASQAGDLAVQYGNPDFSFFGFNHIDLLPAQAREKFTRMAQDGIHIQQIVGDFLEANLSHMPPQPLFSDLLGVTTYHPYVDRVFEKAAGKLAPRGLLAMDVKWGNIYLVDSEGYPVSRRRWFNRFEGLNRGQSVEFDNFWRGSGDLKIPPLKLIYFGLGLPPPIPTRVYLFDP